MHECVHVCGYCMSDRQCMSEIQPISAQLIVGEHQPYRNTS